MAGAELTLKGGKGFELDKVLKNFEKQKVMMPKILGNLAKNHFVEGFRSGGGQTDASRGGWKKRDTDPGRAILVGPGSGKLKRDIRVKIANFKKIVVGTSSMTQDYSESHNKGTSMTVTAKQRGYFMAKAMESTGTKKAFWTRMIGAETITIPKREFIGKSRSLALKIKKRIIKQINKSWRKK